MIRTKYEVIRRNGDVSVEMDAEFEEDITHKFYNHRDIYNFFSRYKFNEFIDDFRNAYNCRVRCHCTYYLRISNGISDLYFGRFLFSTLEIVDRNEPSFLAIPPSFDDRGNQISQIIVYYNTNYIHKLKFALLWKLVFYYFIVWMR